MPSKQSHQLPRAQVPADCRLNPTITNLTSLSVSDTPPDSRPSPSMPDILRIRSTQYAALHHRQPSGIDFPKSQISQPRNKNKTQHRKTFQPINQPRQNVIAAPPSLGSTLNSSDRGPLASIAKDSSTSRSIAFRKHNLDPRHAAAAYFLSSFLFRLMTPGNDSHTTTGKSTTERNDVALSGPSEGGQLPLPCRG